MKKKRIGVVITSRASYARIKSVLIHLKKYKEVELIVIGAASFILDKYGAAYKVMEKDGIALSERVYMVLEGENPTTMAKTVGVGIMELATIFDNYKPDLVITIADRFETIATAIAASYLNIPLVHIQGGEVTGSIDEKVRHAITKLSSFHFVSNQKAYNRVRVMGENPDCIFTTGCPSIDLAAEVLLNSPKIDFDFYEKYKGVGNPIDLNNDYIVVMQHPVTTEYTSAANQMLETLKSIETMRIPTLLFWPNMDAGSDKISKEIRVFREKHTNTDFIYFLKNVEPEDFLRLLINSKGIIGNSSVGIRECSYLGVPCVNVGNRQNGRSRAFNVIDVSYSYKDIIDAAEIHFKQGAKYDSSCIYGDGKAGEKIAEIIMNRNISINKVFIDNFKE